MEFLTYNGTGDPLGRLWGAMAGFFFIDQRIAKGDKVGLVVFHL